MTVVPCLGERRTAASAESRRVKPARTTRMTAVPRALQDARVRDPASSAACRSARESNSRRKPRYQFGHARRVEQVGDAERPRPTRQHEQVGHTGGCGQRLERVLGDRVGLVQQVAQAPGVGHFEQFVQRGRRRSASISTTRRLISARAMPSW